METLKTLALALVLGVIAWYLHSAVFGTSPPSDSTQTASSAQTLAGDASGAAAPFISPSVYEPYSQDEFPKLFARIGSARSRIQPFREAAAAKASSSGRCDRVKYAEISDASTKTELVAFVDCSNGERFVFKESDISDKTSARTQSDKVISRGAAIIACQDAARAAAVFPSTVDAHVWSGATFSSNTTTGNAQVLLNFDAGNELGQKMPYRAECIFQAGSSTAEISVQPR